MSNLNKKLDKTLDFNEVGICMTDASKKVIHQNKRCKEICGDQIDHSCSLCQRPTTQDTQTSPDPFLSSAAIQPFTQTLINNILCDVCKVQENGQKELTIFYPTEQLSTEFESLIKDAGLTTQETKIATLLLKNHSNLDIQNTLNITKATLKTHLNRLYKKCPAVKSYRQNSLTHDSSTNLSLPTL